MLESWHRRDVMRICVRDRSSVECVSRLSGPPFPESSSARLFVRCLAALVTLGRWCLMCDPGLRSGVPSGAPGEGGPRSSGEAVGMVLAGLGWLAGEDMTAVPVAARADCLRELERACSVLTAARSSVLSAFDFDGGCQDDGQGSPRAWLMWQTRVTPGAASDAVGWMRRLRAHPAVAAALRGAGVSSSWARGICDLTDKLPESARDDADAILLAAAAGGAELADLASLADQMRRRLAEPDRDPGRGFEDRRLRLQATLDGTGKLDADLTPQCAAMLQAVLDTLGKKTGPEDDRTKAQRHHDAVAEACRRLLASGCLPDRAGQPARLQLHITLEELTRRLAAAGHQDSAPENAAAGRDGIGAGGPGRDGSWQGGPGITSQLWPRLTDSDAPVPDPAPGWPLAAPGEECDASIVPVVTGYLDHDLLTTLTAALASQSRPGPSGKPLIHLDPDSLRDLIITHAAALFSGPRGLASWLRTRTLNGPAASVSLPLDTGTSTETIPPHLRRAVIQRDRHCAAPGCTVPPSACQVHHILPRSQGGITKLTNLILLCSFHHLILVHGMHQSRLPVWRPCTVRPRHWPAPRTGTAGRDGTRLGVIAWV